MPGTWGPVNERFWRFVVPSEGCWTWAGSLVPSGYGQMKVDGKPVRAHRLSWEMHFGPIPTGMEVCHHCDNRSCVRPDHLYLGTHSMNMRDMNRKGRGLGTIKPGEARHRTLSDAQVAAVRVDLRPSRVVAREYGVHQTTVVRVRNGSIWKNGA